MKCEECEKEIDLNTFNFSHITNFDIICNECQDKLKIEKTKLIVEMGKRKALRKEKFYALNRFFEKQNIKDYCY